MNKIKILREISVFLRIMAHNPCIAHETSDTNTLILGKKYFKQCTESSE